eukprot:TRINITY_DN14265_c0_g1_i1.p1 TRINITY_DN14265_c0_g1~~TRINITY_DN14265_c0_g1_i1.p1  ORF type:complete len:855 (+),score=143.95 TRINITY_DN14265_c0_g1_i1:48-2612(+)
MTSWVLDIYQAKNILGFRSENSYRRCNPKVNVEYAGEKIGSSFQVMDSKDPVWNDVIKGTSKETVGRLRNPLTFKVVHKPEYAPHETVLSYAKLFITSDNSKESRKRLQLKSDTTQDENGGWIEVGWKALDKEEERRRTEREERLREDEDRRKKAQEREDEERKLKEQMLKNLTSPKSGSPRSTYRVGDKIQFRDDDTLPWKEGTVQEISPDGLPRVKLQKSTTETKPAEPTKTENEKPAEQKKQTSTDTGVDPAIPSAKLHPNQAYQLAQIVNMGIGASSRQPYSSEIEELTAKKEAAVKAERYAEAQEIKEKITGLRGLQEQSRAGWRTEAPVSSLVRAVRRIDFENGKCIEAGTLGEVIGGLVRMGSSLFVPTPGDVEAYGPAQSQVVPSQQPQFESIPTSRGHITSSPSPAPVSMDSVNMNTISYTAPHEMSIVVQQLTEPGVEFVIKSVSPSDTISTIKLRIQGINGVPSTSQCLSQQLPDGRKRKLEDSRTLSSYGVRSGDILQISRSSGLSHVIVNIEGRQKVRITMPYNGTVLSLKQRLQEKERIPVSNQVIEWCGEVLVDHRQLSSYGLSPTSVLNMYDGSGTDFGSNSIPRQTRVSTSPQQSFQILKLSIVDETLPYNNHHVNVQHVNRVPYKILTIDCRPTDTIESVKERLYAQAGMPIPSNFELLFNNSPLRDSYTLQESCIHNGCTLTAVLVSRSYTGDVGGDGGGVVETSNVGGLQEQVATMTRQMDELRSRNDQLVTAVENMATRLHTPHWQGSQQSPLLDSRSQLTSEVLSHSKALRSVAESEVARVSNQLGNLDIPLQRNSLRSPPRTNRTPLGSEIIGSERFRQMQKVALERNEIH